MNRTEQFAIGAVDHEPLDDTPFPMSKQVLIQKPVKAVKPRDQELDTRTPSGKKLPY